MAWGDGKCKECGALVSAIAENLYLIYCSAACARKAALKREQDLLAALKDMRKATRRILGTGHDLAQDAEGRAWLIGVNNAAEDAIRKAEGA